MKPVGHVMAAVGKQYDRRWRDWLVDDHPKEIRFVLGAPTRAEIERDPVAVDLWLRRWSEWAANSETGHLETKRVNTVFGPQPVYTALTFVDVSSLAETDAKLEAHWRLATQRWGALVSFSISTAIVKRHLTSLVNLSPADFQTVLAAAQWFRRYPRSGLMPRQVPIEGMHTKWLAKHRSLVLALFGQDPADANDDPTVLTDINQEDKALAQTDLDPLGLVMMPAMLDIILSDPADREHVGGLRHIRAPAVELAALRLTPSVVLIVENKESALILPDAPGLIVVHSLGNNLGVLASLIWLAGARLTYWGDLDRAGFTLLSRARKILPRLESVLMDEDTLLRHYHLAGREVHPRIDGPADTLSDEEQLTLARLSRSGPVAGHLQIEQERLAAGFVLHKMLSVVSEWRLIGSNVAMNLTDSTTAADAIGA